MMIKRVVVVVLFALFLVGTVSAISSDMKEVYEPKETAIVKLSGSILQSISDSQFSIKRINVNVPVDYGVKKIGEEYYFWFVAPENAGSYTLNISGIRSTVLGINSIVDYVKNFEVSGNLTNYYIKPGLMSTDKDFQISAIVNTDEIQTISVDFPEAKTLNLQPGENKIVFSISGKASQVGKITVGKYSVPFELFSSILCGNGIVDSGEECDYNNESTINNSNIECKNYNSIYNSGNLNCTRECKISFSGCRSLCGNGIVDSGEECDYNNESTINEGNLNCSSYNSTWKSGKLGCNLQCKIRESDCSKYIKGGGLVIDHDYIKATALSGEVNRYSFTLINNGKDEVRGIYLLYTSELISVVPGEKINLKPEESIQYNITLKANKKFISKIGVAGENISIIQIILDIDFTSNPEQVLTDYNNADSGTVGPSCREIGGVACVAGESCTGSLIQSSDGACCTNGICKKAEGSSNSWIGWVIALVVVATGVFVWYKYYRTGGEKSVFKSNLINAERKL